MIQNPGVAGSGSGGGTVVHECPVISEYAINTNGALDTNKAYKFACYESSNTSAAVDPIIFGEMYPSGDGNWNGTIYVAKSINYLINIYMYTVQLRLSGNSLGFTAQPSGRFITGVTYIFVELEES